MKKTILTLLLAAVSTGTMAQVFECDEPKGTWLSSKEYPNVKSDKYSGAKPVVTVEGKEMRVVWIGPKSYGGKSTSTVIQQSPRFITAAYTDSSRTADGTSLYSIDVKRGYFYFTTHNANDAMDESFASTYIAKCSVRSLQSNQ